MIHAQPLNARDEAVAARFPHQTGNLFGTFFRRADDEAIVDQSIELSLLVFRDGCSIGHSEAAKDLVAGRNRWSNISNGCLTVSRHNNVAQHREV